MIKPTELLDIQGNILKGYAFPHVAHLFGSIEPSNVETFRMFLRGLVGEVTAADWGAEKPATTLNMGVSYVGLSRLQPALAREIAAQFPAFAQGMPARAKLLGDTKASPVWENRHVWLAVHAQSAQGLEARVRELLQRASSLAFSDDARAAALVAGGHWYEHFGFRDDISYPILQGTPRTTPEEVKGRGKRNEEGRWVPLSDGEFILGHEDERSRDALAGLSASARALLRNGTFGVFRDLRQHVVEFRRYLRQQAEHRPGVSAEFMASRMVGREPSGEPLARTQPRGDGQPELSDFRYEDDGGSTCPLGAHVRLANPRTDGQHRLIRRGMSYGRPLAPGQEDTEPRGLYFVAFNANIEEQFELVQAQWLNVSTGNVPGACDPIAGAASPRAMVIEGDHASNRMPLLLFNVPEFVSSLGGQYFLYPALGGLQAICAPAPLAVVSALHEMRL